MSFSPARGQQNGGGLTGVWTSDDGGMDIEFFKCGAEICGAIAALHEDDGSGKPPLDENNPDASLRGRPLLGLRIITGLTLEEEGRWSGGTMYAPEKGLHVGVEVTLVATHELEMTVRKLFFRRKATWRRVET
ncbi:MAG: DUF2147 domain-containing protein [Rhodothermales bacterium]